MNEPKKSILLIFRNGGRNGYALMGYIIYIGTKHPSNVALVCKRFLKILLPNNKFLLDVGVKQVYIDGAGFFFLLKKLWKLLLAMIKEILFTKTLLLIVVSRKIG